MRRCPTKLDATFILLNDDEDRIIKQPGTVTWYDAREKHATRTEYRFYYSSNEVIDNASPGDLMVIGKTSKETVAVIIAPQGSTSEKQLLWLFGLGDVVDKFVTEDLSEKKSELGYAGKYIISSLGFEVVEAETDYLQLLLKTFNGIFPATATFSEFARKHTKDVNPIEAPDEALLKWMEKEQTLFKTLESHFVKEQLQQGFGTKNDDVDAFIRYSLSVQNRRKARAGAAFEHHVAHIFDCNKVNYSKQEHTERNNKPDFLFPGIAQYRNSQFDAGLLTMLGLKTSAKERWTQILSEADRIWPKHLITLEPAISKNQTDEMIAKKVQLVIPGEIINTYNADQQKNIISLSQFMELVKGKLSKNI